jgi:hypothetical protein
MCAPRGSPAVRGFSMGKWRHHVTEGVSHAVLDSARPGHVRGADGTCPRRGRDVSEARTGRVRGLGWRRYAVKDASHGHLRASAQEERFDGFVLVSRRMHSP